MQIILSHIPVSDQEKALRFYTDILGFVQKNRNTHGGIPMVDRGSSRKAQ